MQLITMHLYSPEIATRYVQALRGEISPAWSWWDDELKDMMKQPLSEIAANRISSGLALAMADDLAIFHCEGLGLTPWESTIDRGLGMLMRPPARAFVDNGVHPLLLHSMPIRLDLQGGIMAGAWIPPHLIDKFDQLIDARLELWAKRLNEAESDPYPLLAAMRMVADEARTTGLGVIEAINVIQPGTPVIETPNRKKMDAQLRARIDGALAEEKTGFLNKLFRKGS